MTRALDLSRTFIHLDDEGSALPVKVTRSFWSSATAARYARVLGVLDFDEAADLHPSEQEVHPEADEVLYLVSGSIEVVLDGAGGERSIVLEPGQAAVVPRGTWHHLVMRRPGRLLFVNSRSGMQSRRRPSPERR